MGILLEDGNSYMCGMHDTPRVFGWCEDNCSRYYQCDTVACAVDEAKLKDGEAWLCKNCEIVVNNRESCSRCNSGHIQMSRNNKL